MHECCELQGIPEDGLDRMGVDHTASPPFGHDASDHAARSSAGTCAAAFGAHIAQASRLICDETRPLQFALPILALQLTGRDCTDEFLYY